MSERPVRIAGVGMTTPLGRDASETWEALLQGEHVREHARAKAADGIAGLATRAAREAVNAAGWSTETLTDERSAIVLATSKGPVQRWLTPLSHMAIGPYAAGGLDLTGLAELGAQIARILHFGLGPRLTVSSACASGLHALIRAAMMIRGGEADRALVIAAEASFHPLFVGSFSRLGVLPPPGELCRPFDRHRNGFLMSEAAAAMCVEAAASPPAGVCVERFALGADAVHITDLDPEATTLKRLLARVIDGQSVDLVHAHGTGTQPNDAAELAALEATLPRHQPPPVLYSHKGALGHSLGAAGLLAVVINCLIHRAGNVPGNATIGRPLAARAVEVPTTTIRRTVKRSVVMASGFGGGMAAVSLVSV